MHKAVLAGLLILCLVNFSGSYPQNLNQDQVLPRESETTKILPIASTWLDRNSSDSLTIYVLELRGADHPINSYFVEFQGLRAELRTDGNDYTSLEIEREPADSRSRSNGTIWVPNEEDLERWRDYITEKRDLRTAFLERSRHHCRILPEESTCHCSGDETATTGTTLYSVNLSAPSGWLSYNENRALIVFTFIIREHLFGQSWLAFKCEYVYADAVEIRLRTDGQTYTSAELGEQMFVAHRGNPLCSSAVILVPYEEDAAIWQNWLGEKINEYGDWRRNYISPRRVLPPEGWGT